MALVPSKSTVISEAFLAASAAWALFRLRGGLPLVYYDTANQFAQVWFFLIMLSSVTGIFRFSSDKFFSQLTPIHDTLTWLSLTVGLPSLVCQFYANQNLQLLANMHLLASVPTIISWVTNIPFETDRSTQLLSLFCHFSMAANALYYQNYCQLVATIIMVLGFNFLRSNMKNSYLEPIDCFHYGIMITNILLVAALGLELVPEGSLLRPLAKIFYGEYTD